MRAELAAAELRRGTRAFIAGRDTDAIAHFRTVVALLEGVERGLS